MATLSAPVSPKDHVQGNANAAVTLVEYGDYECPSCGAAYPIVKRLQKEFGDELRFVHRNFPLPQHDFAEFAAETAEFAATEGQFWEMHDALYENQADMDDDLFPKLADDLELDPAALTKALEHGKFEDRVAEDIESGEASGVQGTPTFFINGKQHEGSIGYEALVAAIRAAAGSRS